MLAESVSGALQETCEICKRILYCKVLLCTEPGFFWVAWQQQCLSGSHKAGGSFSGSAGACCAVRCGWFFTLWLPAGNYAFAKDYDQVVRDTWSIINNQAGGDLLSNTEPCLTPYPAHWVALASFLTLRVSLAVATTKESLM